MDHFVSLDRLPDGLEFPERVRDRISYDPTRKALVYHGPMSRSHYALLWSLSSDWGYRGAVEALFRKANSEPERERQGVRTRMLALGLGILILAIVAIVIWRFVV